MKKTFKSYLITWGVLLVLFNVIAFVSPAWEGQTKYTPSFWIGYVFITLAFVGQLFCAKAVFSAKNLQKLFYNIPLVRVSLVGLVVSFVAGGLCMLISPLPYWIGVIVCAIVLTVTIIAVVKASIAAETVSAIDEKLKVQTFFIRSLTVDAEGLVARAQTEEIKTECKKVYEAARYSDPMSHEALAATESQIALKFAELAEAVGANDGVAVKKTANEIVVLIGDRNKKCRLLK